MLQRQNEINLLHSGSFPKTRSQTITANYLKRSTPAVLGNQTWPLSSLLLPITSAALPRVWGSADDTGIRERPNMCMQVSDSHRGLINQSLNQSVNSTGSTRYYNYIRMYCTVLNVLHVISFFFFPSIYSIVRWMEQARVLIFVIALALEMALPSPLFQRARLRLRVCTLHFAVRRSGWECLPNGGNIM